MKVSLSYLFPVLFVILVIQACTEDTNDPLPTFGKLGGQVTGSYGQHLENATIKISTPNFNAELKTNEFGRYLFEDLATGDYKIEVSKETFIGKSEMLSLQPNVVNEADFSLEVGEEILMVPDSLINAGVKSGVFELRVLSNTSWTISSDSEWASLSSSGGNGDSKLLVTWTENMADSTKTAILTLKSGKIQQSIKVIQASAIKIIDTKGIGGNQLASDPHSKVTITFSRPISLVQRIDPLFRNCQGASFSPILNSDRTELTFTYSCGRLGIKYPFTIEFLDDENNSHIENFDVEFYDKKLAIDGMVSSTYAAPNEDKLWITTTAPAKVYKIDMNKFEIEKEFKYTELGPYEHTVTLNPYNNLLYISNRGKLDVYNPETGQLVKSISLPKPEYDLYSDHYVFSMAFNKKGLGILSLRHTGSSGEKWVKIDSSKDHLISIPAEYGYEEGQFHQAFSVSTSNDQKKLRFVVPDGNNRGFYESNEALTEFTEALSFVGEAGFNSAVYSKADDRTILDLQDFSVIDGDNFYRLGYLGYSNIAFEFLYNTTKPLIYCAAIERGAFFIYDYKQKEITQQYSSGDWRYTGGTLDGKHLIVRPHDMEYNESTDTFESNLLLFLTDAFYR
ncbi:carboxypeptidase regulatory-like domain-containing protein [Algoriphagus sp. NG3]|uniref:carboxypeptidase regulatory-like domain-containing protein n=1 Tax=Algoriphagus sp. NG3 TaxID=3097546 RepID=UPI002A7F34A1|nr:carboxypeptidase regulatory-like domain-containing protein [Algoriphagus sp. NG3]WPR77671.1 carboxypeptidase regulatory-like domain-containing protein [Algoriphagus sp. NG3]